jgi:predicted transcriptional regulator of viral defense system
VEAADCQVLPVERRVAEVAGRQHAVITTRQLAGLGLGRHWISHRIRTGWLRRRHRGVYLVGPVEPPLARAMAAVLAVGDGALLSHYPAAVLWGMCPAPAGELHVTLAARNALGPAGVTVHRVNHLHLTDSARHQGIPVTSPARTLLDLAAAEAPRVLGRATNEARVLSLVTDHSLDEQLARYPTHRGVAAMRRATQTEPQLTRSEPSAASSS